MHPCSGEPTLRWVGGMLQCVVLLAGRGAARKGQEWLHCLFVTIHNKCCNRIGHFPAIVLHAMPGCPGCLSSQLLASDCGRSFAPMRAPTSQRCCPLSLAGLAWDQAGAPADAQMHVSTVALQHALHQVRGASAGSFGVRG